MDINLKKVRLPVVRNESKAGCRLSLQFSENLKPSLLLVHPEARFKKAQKKGQY